MSAAGSKFVFSNIVLALVFSLSGGLSAVAQAAGDCAQEQFSYREARHLYDANQNLLSAVHFSMLRGSNCDTELASHSWFGYVMALSRLQEVSEALTVTDQALQSPKVTAHDKAALRMQKTWLLQQPAGELAPEQLTRWHLWEGRFARPEFLQTLTQSSFSGPEKTQLSDLQLRLITAPRKSLWTAGLASAVLPGAGQAYVGNWQTAALSFVINAIFFAATAEFARKEMPAAAVASGTVFSITYIGNILSATQSANEANKLARAGTETELKEKMLPELTF